jgi:hypothetical protein
MSETISSKQDPFLYPRIHTLEGFPKLIDTQSILGSTSEQQNTSYSMGSMISGIGLMTERGILLGELREEHFTLVLW